MRRTACGPCLDTVVSPPVLFMQGEDAERLGLADGEFVVLTTETGSVKVALRVVDEGREAEVIAASEAGRCWLQAL